MSKAVLVMDMPENGCMDCDVTAVGDCRKYLSEKLD